MLLEEDLTPFAAMNADPRVMEFFSKTLTRTESGALAERIRAQLNQHAFGLAVELVQQMPNSSVSSAWQKPLSDALYSLCRNRLEIGPKVFGARYALEAAQRVLKYAFEDLCLPELVSFTAANNLRSQQLMHRLGLSGTLPTISSTRLLAEGHDLRKHVLYRLRRAECPREVDDESDWHNVEVATSARTG